MRKLLYPILLLTLTACSSMFPNYDLAGMFYGSSANADERFEASMKYTDAHEPLQFVVDDNYKVYVATDSHVDSTTRNMETFMRAYRSDLQSPFALHLGDLINAKENYNRFNNSLLAMPEGYVRKTYDTLLVTCGNHDIYFGQWREFLQYYKTSSYWFETVSNTTGKPLDLYICYDSSSGSVGRKQLDWLRSLLLEKSKQGYRHIILFTHTHFFKQDATQGHSSNYSMEETAELTGMFSQYGVSLVLTGHDHSREVTTYGGVRYIIVDAIEDHYPDAFYLIATMGKQINYEFVAL